MTQRPAEQAAERHVVALLDEPVPVPVPQVGRTVTVRRTGDKPDVGSFTMSMTLLQQKQEASPLFTSRTSPDNKRTALGCCRTA